MVPLAETLKVEVAVKQNFSAQISSAFYVLTALWVVLMAIVSPFWYAQNLLY